MQCTGLEVVPVCGENVQTYERLMQSYECEFSSITGKMPDPEGKFPLDTHLDDRHLGFLGYLDGIPAGFNVIRKKEDGAFEVCEFFIVPVFRKRRLGFHLASEVFSRYRGRWEIKQIAGADHATAFWRKAVHRYTGGHFREDLYTDDYWGVVTRQSFVNR